MRIVFLCTSSADNASPRGRWIPIADALVKRGHWVQVLCLHPQFDVEKEQLQAPKPSWSHSMGQAHAQVFHVGQMHVERIGGVPVPLSGIRLLRVAFRSAMSLARYARALEPDIVHVCKPQPINGIAALMLKATTKARLFVDCDDLEKDANQFASNFQKNVVDQFERNFPRLTQGITVNTSFLREYFFARGVSRDRIKLIPNGVNSQHAFQTQRNPNCISYVGQMAIHSHAVDLLLDAFALVVKQASQAQLLMIGSGPDHEKLMKHAEDIGISQHVKWCGEMPHPAAIQLLSGCICTVDPARNLPVMKARSPLKIVEALSVGTPVITTDVGDRKDTVSKAGIVVAHSTPDALAQGMLQILGNPALFSKMSGAASDSVNKYVWSQLVNDWESVYAV